MTHTSNRTTIPAKSILGFPVTPFTPSDKLDLDVCAELVEIVLSYGARALFPGCGTGEMQSLSVDEHRSLVTACVTAVNGRVPVYAGIGFGLAIAQQMMRAAADAGASGALIFPPYLAVSDPESLYQYYAAIAAAAPIGVIVYQRDGLLVEPEILARLSQIDNIVGFKDGTGQIDRVQRQVAAVDGSPLAFFNGTPTAELFVPAMACCGVESYSSALLNVMPEFAHRFHAAFAVDETELMRHLINDVVLPFVRLRDRSPGYAVSLVKAGARLRGLPVGRVRAPIPEPSATDEKDLRSLLESLGLDHPLAPRGADEPVWRHPDECVSAAEH